MVVSGIVQVKAGITPEIVEAMTKHSSTLSKMRKKRQVSETLATPDEVATLDLEGTYPLHKTTQASHRVTYQPLDTGTQLDLQRWADCTSSPVQGGILALDFQPGAEHLVFTAGVDHTGQVFDLEANRVLASLNGHAKKVTGTALGRLPSVFPSLTKSSTAHRLAMRSQLRTGPGL